MAPAGMGKGVRGTSSWKCIVLCAYSSYSQTLSKTIYLLFMHYFHIFEWCFIQWHLAVLACVLRATSKKVVNFFEEKMCTPPRDMDMHLCILDMPINLLNPGKICGHQCVLDFIL